MKSGPNTVSLLNSTFLINNYYYYGGVGEVIGGGIGIAGGYGKNFQLYAFYVNRGVIVEGGINWF